MEWWMVQLRWLMVLVVGTGSLTVSHSAPLQDWTEFPLTPRDLQLVKIGGEVPITTNSVNQTCLLTPSEIEGEGEGCTWRTQEECRRIPTITSVPVYSPWCKGEGQGAHLTNCKERVRTVPIVHSVEVCSPTGSPDCRGPCYNCGQYCAPAQQSWCEQSHSISTLVTDKRECREVEGGECEDILKRTEKDVVKTTENCYQKDVELCGPVNCKFVNITNKCHEKNNTIQVELRERECEVCEPTVAEKVKIEEDCQEVLTTDCVTDPLSRTWKKFCGEEETNFVETKKFKFDDIEEPRSQNNLENTKFTVEDLIHESLAPVNNLVFETLKQIHIEDIESSTPVVIISQTQESSTEDVSDVLKLLELEEEVLVAQELQTNPTTININVQLDPNISDISRAPSSAVYFDQILNTLRKQTELDNNSSSVAVANVSAASPPSLTEVLDLQLQSQFLQQTTTTINVPRKIDANLEKTTVSLKTTEQSSSEGYPESLTTTGTFLTSITPTSTTPTTMQATSTPATSTPATITPATSTPAITEGVTKGDKKLSAAEFLRQCFISHTGCDFSQNEIESKPTPEEDFIVPVTTSTPIAITTEAYRKPKNIQERLKQRVKLCFFSGLCNDSDFETTKRPQPSTTTQRLTTSASLRETEIQRRVQERARACFFEGRCN